MELTTEERLLIEARRRQAAEREAAKPGAGFDMSRIKPGMSDEERKAAWAACLSAQKELGQ